MRNEVIVQKLLAYTEKILRYCDGVDYDAFAADSKLVEACVFNLSQILAKWESYAEVLTVILQSSTFRFRGTKCTDFATGSSMIMRA